MVTRPRVSPLVQRRIADYVTITNVQGFIGFFDILGYSAFLESDSTIQTTERVLEIITSSGIRADFLIDKVWDLHPEANTALIKGGPTIRELFTAFKATSRWSIWSDTIVLTVGFEPSSERTATSFLNQIGILYHAALSAGALAEQMFLAGLPVRGALHFGEYFQRDNTLAGKATIEAYKLCNRLDLAATVVSSAAMAFTRVNVQQYGIQDLSYFIATEYDVPMNDGRAEKMAVLTGFDWRRTSQPSLEEAVYNSFKAHGKTMGGNAPRKADNTIKLWRTVPKPTLAGLPFSWDQPGQWIRTFGSPG